MPATYTLAIVRGKQATKPISNGETAAAEAA